MVKRHIIVAVTNMLQPLQLQGFQIPAVHGFNVFLEKQLVTPSLFSFQSKAFLPQDLPLLFHPTIHKRLCNFRGYKV